VGGNKKGNIIVSTVKDIIGSEIILTISLNDCNRGLETCEDGPPPPAAITNEKENMANNSLCI
tara:strand:+ start:44 stop:232 length:189 start_codon:yes stop_codon:yes gene_type:complete